MFDAIYQLACFVLQVYSASGRNVVYERMFDKVIVASAVKFVVISFQGEYACLRVELYGSPCGKSDYLQSSYICYITFGTEDISRELTNSSRTMGV